GQVVVACKLKADDLQTVWFPGRPGGGQAVRQICTVEKITHGRAQARGHRGRGDLSNRGAAGAAQTDVQRTSYTSGASERLLGARGWIWGSS
ncbi:hypothetical protein EJ02DRAFT_333457, partial [Clathrospora elynae]